MRNDLLPVRNCLISIYPYSFLHSFVHLLLLTTANPNQMREVILFVCSKMADETNLSSKLPVAIEQERSEEESSVGDALALPFRCARFCLALLILFASYSPAPLLMRPRHFARSCALCSHDTVGILNYLREALRVPCIASFDHYGVVFRLAVLHRGLSSANVHQAFW